jgi:hypothetical protein
MAVGQGMGSLDACQVRQEAEGLQIYLYLSALRKCLIPKAFWRFRRNQRVGK